MKFYRQNKRINDLWIFAGVFCVIFLITFVALYYLNLVPGEVIVGEDKGGVTDALKLQVLNNTDTKAETTPEGPGEKPIRIEIPKVGVDVSVSNPETKNNTILNEYLTKGAVRYPDSGTIGKGNMLIFGHSTNWKVVQNQAYKALNGIDKLKAGDDIYVKSDNDTYVYKVTSERLADATETEVDFSKNKNMLTLSTCDLFGEKQQRFVVEADFVGKK